MGRGAAARGTPSPPPPIVGGGSAPPPPAPPPPAPPPPPRPPGAPPGPGGAASSATGDGGEKRSRAMTTLNWEKMSSVKASNTMWGNPTGGAQSALQKLLGSGKKLTIDTAKLEGKFFKPESKARPGSMGGAGGGAGGGGAGGAGGGGVARAAKVQILDGKRSTSVGIVANKMERMLQVVIPPHPVRRGLTACLPLFSLLSIRQTDSRPFGWCDPHPSRWSTPAHSPPPTPHPSHPSPLAPCAGQAAARRDHGG